MDNLPNHQFNINTRIVCVLCLLLGCLIRGPITILITCIAVFLFSIHFIKQRSLPKQILIIVLIIGFFALTSSVRVSIEVKNTTAKPLTACLVDMLGKTADVKSLPVNQIVILDSYGEEAITLPRHKKYHLVVLDNSGKIYYSSELTVDDLNHPIEITERTSNANIRL